MHRIKKVLVLGETASVAGDRYAITGDGSDVQVGTNLDEVTEMLEARGRYVRIETNEYSVTIASDDAANDRGALPAGRAWRPGALIEQFGVHESRRGVPDGLV